MPRWLPCCAPARDEKFLQVNGVNDEAADQGELGDLVNVAHRDDVFETAPLAERNQNNEHHAEAAEHGTDHEVERENRCVPARELRGAEVETDDGTHCEHQHRAEAAENNVGFFVIMPVPRRAGPTHRKQAENKFARTRRRPITEHGKVRNHAHEPK